MTTQERVDTNNQAQDAERFFALSSPVRLALLMLIAEHGGRLNVQALEARLHEYLTYEVSQPTVSHHLRILKQVGFIEGKHEGLEKYYRLRRESLGYSCAPDEKGEHMSGWLKWMVPRKEYESLQDEAKRLQAQVADLTGKYTALGFDEALVRSLAQRAIKLLQRVDTTRTGGVAFKQEIDALVGEARSAGLLEEKR